MILCVFLAVVLVVAHGFTNAPRFAARAMRLAAITEVASIPLFEEMIQNAKGSGALLVIDYSTTW